VSVKPRVKNALVLGIVSTLFLIPVLVLGMHIFSSIDWGMLAFVSITYFVIIFAVFLYYSRAGKK